MTNIRSLAAAGLVAFAAAVNLRSNQKSSLQAEVYASVKRDLSVFEHDQDELNRMTASMSLEEAMEKAGNLIPKEVRTMLAQGSVSNGQAPATVEYNGLKGVVDRINEMYLSTFKDLDLTKIECYTTLLDLKHEQYVLQMDDQRMTGDLADDQASLIDWAATKNNALTNIQSLTESMKKNQDSCSRETAAVEDIIQLMSNDFDVAYKVVVQSACAPPKGGSSGPPATNNATIVSDADKRAWYSGKSGTGTAALVQASEFFMSNGMMTEAERVDAANADPSSPDYAKRPFDLKHPVYYDSDVDLVNHKGEVLLQCILPSGESFMSFQKPAIAEAILQLSNGHFQKLQKKMIALMQMVQAPNATANSSNGTAIRSTSTAGVPATPAGTTVPKSVQNAKCSISGSPQCPKFLESISALVTEIKTGIVEQQNYLAALTKNCSSINKQFIDNIGSYQKDLDLANIRIGQLNARTTQTQAGLDEVRRTAKSKAAVYTKKYTECTQATADANGVICGIQKIKTDLLRMSKIPDFVQDCVVSKFIYGECSVSCGPNGGVQNLTREITTKPTSQWGADCPALTAMAVCNKFACPIDCLTGPFTDYTRCSASCGTGSRYRFRDVLQEPKNNGQPCGPRQEMSLCGQTTCDKDCVLSDWTPFGPCSAACNGGYKERRRNILEPTKGQGFCPTVFEQRRFDRQMCNPQSCPTEKPVCQARADVVFAVDMSGSVGFTGWNAQIQFLTTIIRQFDFSYMRVGIVLFSTDVYVWAPLTDDQDWLLERLALAPGVWQGQLTATAQALSKAKTLLTDGGRPNAASVVIVLTDGMPTGPMGTMDEAVKTPQVAADIRKVARLMFVGVGSGVNGKNAEIMKSWSSDGGKNNNFAQVPSFEALTLATDDLIIAMCPEIKNLVPAPTASDSLVDPATQTAKQLGNDKSDAKATLVQASHAQASRKAHYGVVTWGDAIQTAFDDEVYGPVPDTTIY